MRLNHNLRMEIIRNALAVRFDKERTQLDKDEAALAEAAYNYVFDAKAREAIDTLRKITPGWFNPQTIFVVDVDYHGIELAGNKTFFLARNCMNTIAKLSTRPNPLKPGEAAMAKEVQAHAERRHKLKNDRQVAERQLTILLKSVHSTEKLKEVWPEGAALYSSPPLKPVMSALPAVQVVELNKMLGLAA